MSQEEYDEFKEYCKQFQQIITVRNLRIDVQNYSTAMCVMQKNKKTSLHTKRVIHVKEKERKFNWNVVKLNHR